MSSPPIVGPFFESLLKHNENEETFDYINLEAPCIIFLNLLKAHKKIVAVANVEKWLNHGMAEDESSQW